VSNDHDEVTGDGQEPVGAASSDEAADLSATDAAAGLPSGDRRERARTAPASASGADDVSGTEPDATAPAAGSSPVAAGSARAAARRSAARAGVSETKGAATPKRAAATTVKRPNIFARFSRFLREVVAELRKVIWPTKNQMVTYTIVVIAFVAFMVALVGVLDLLFAKGVLAVFG
jgi:preprotein translocase subunit SecE